MIARVPSIEIYAGRAGVERLQGLWGEIARQHGAGGVFEDPQLALIAAEAAEAGGSRPLIVVVRDGDGRARTLLPLRLTGRCGVRTAQALTAPLAQYSDVVGAALSAYELSVVSAKLYSEYGVDLMLFRRVRSDGGLADALAANGLAQNAATSAPYIDLEAFGSFAAYEASFSNSTRRSRRRRREKLEEACGALEFSVLQGEDALPMLDAAIAWKRAWLESQGLKSPVLDGGPWEKSLRASAASLRGVTSVLLAGTRPVAIELGFLAHGVYTSYLGAFDPEFARFGVGQEQLRRTIEWAFDAGATRFDLMAPSDDYKLQLTRSPETAVAVEDYVVPLTTLGRGMAEVRKHARPAARSLVLNIHPDVRAVGTRYAKPAAIAVAALSLALALE